MRSTVLGQKSKGLTREPDTRSRPIGVGRQLSQNLQRIKRRHAPLFKLGVQLLFIGSKCSASTPQPHPHGLCFRLIQPRRNITHRGIKKRRDALVKTIRKEICHNRFDPHLFKTCGKSTIGVLIICNNKNRFPITSKSRGSGNRTRDEVRVVLCHHHIGSSARNLFDYVLDLRGLVPNSNLLPGVTVGGICGLRLSSRLDLSGAVAIESHQQRGLLKKLHIRQVSKKCRCGMREDRQGHFVPESKTLDVAPNFGNFVEGASRRKTPGPMQRLKQEVSVYVNPGCGCLTQQPGRNLNSWH